MKPLGAVALAVTLGLSVTSQAQLTKLTPIPNSVKYADNSKPNGKGRSGNAVLQVRGLMGKDGVTTIEATTSNAASPFDPAPADAPGTISKIQQKLFDSSYKLISSTNFKSGMSGGYFEGTTNAALLHQPIQLQANIDSIDSGTDVVTVQESVKLRPDLSAHDLQSPQQAPLFHLVHFMVSIGELNRDVGAYADCNLYADDGTGPQLIGHSASIWIDAGGSAACSFEHVFTTAGTYQLRAAVENVHPGDWDETNNSVTGQIIISGLPLHGGASFRDYSLTQTDTTEDDALDASGAWTPTYIYKSTAQVRQQSVFLEAYNMQNATPGPVVVSVHELADGVESGIVPGINQISLPLEEFKDLHFPNYRFALSISSLYLSPTRQTIQVWSQLYNDPSVPTMNYQETGVEYTRSADDVMYLDTLADGSGTYVSLSTSHQGVFVPEPSASFEIDISVTDASGATFYANPLMTLSFPAATSSSSTYCYPPYLSARACYSYTATWYNMAFGATNF